MTKMTHIILDTDDKDYVYDVVSHLRSSSVSVQKGLPWVDLINDKKAPVHVFYGEKFSDDVESRILQLGLANAGTVLLSESTTDSPMYAGTLPKNPARVKVHLDYAESRAKLFKVPGLSYTGPVLQDPKNLIFLDPGKGTLPMMSAILKDASPKWWPSTGFIRSATPRALEKTINDHFYYSAVVYFSDKIRERLENAGRTEYVLDATDLKPSDPQLAVKLRNLTYRSDAFDTEINTNLRNIIDTSH